MATLDRSILGDIKGKVGNIVFRKMNNKTFVSLRPEVYKTSNSPAALYSRNRFINISLFASFLNGIDPIKNCWKESKTPGTIAYKKIIKSNSPLMDGEFISPANRVLPEKNIENDIVLTDVTDTLKIEMKKRKFDLLRIILVSVFEKPGKKGLPEISCHKMEGVFTDVTSTYNITKDTIYAGFAKEYERVIIFPVVLLNYKGKTSMMGGKSFAS